MNRKLYAALKPGGMLVIADHSAKPGAGTSVGKSLHRIEESALRREVEAAGFKLVAEGDFWRHPRMRVTSRSNRRAEGRWTSSCSNFRSRCEQPRRDTVAG
jgi:predicted methyltransferase